MNMVKAAVAAERMRAEEFVDLIDKAIATKPNERIEIENIKVAGRVELAGREFPSGLHLDRVTFDNDLNLNNCKFNDTVAFSQCAFGQAADLSNSTLNNRFSLEDCTFGSLDTIDRSALSLDGAQIDGDVGLLHIQTSGRISARRLRLRGDLTFTSCQIDANADVEIGAVDLTSSEILGNTKFEASAPPQQSPLGLSGDALNARSHYKNHGNGPSLRMRHAKAADISLNYALFRGHVDLMDLNCSSLSSTVGWFSLPLDETGSPQPGTQNDKTFDGAHIEGRLQLFNGQFGYIYLRGITVTQDVLMADGASGPTYIEDGIITDYKPNFFCVTSTIGNLVIIRWHCRDVMSIHPRKVRGIRNEFRMRGIHILSSHIDRLISFWPGRDVSLAIWNGYRSLAGTLPVFYFADANEPLKPVPDGDPLRKRLNRWDSRLLVKGTVNIDHCDIGGNVEMTGIEMVGDKVRGEGWIDLRHCNVAGDVLFHSPISFLADIPENDPTRRLAARYFVARHYLLDQTTGKSRQIEWPMMCSCGRVDMQWLSSRNVDLSGLHIRKNDAASSEAADVVLCSSKVRGSLFTLVRLSEKNVKEIWEEIDHVLPPNAPVPNPENVRYLTASFGEENVRNFQEFENRKSPSDPFEANADIAGALSLAHAEIEELRVSDSSFLKRDPRRKASDAGIVLDYARVNKFYVGRGESRGKPDAHNGFPVPVSLLDVAVNSWFLEAANQGKPRDGYIDRETTEAEPYLDLLDNDPNFRMSSYLHIEKALRDRGLELEARHVYIAGHYRDMRQHGWTKHEPAPNAGSQEPAPVKRKPPWRWRHWQAGDGRYRQAWAMRCFPHATRWVYWSIGRRQPPKYPIVFRIMRPWRESVAFLIGLAWSIAIFWCGLKLLPNPTKANLSWLFGVMAGVVASYFILRAPLRLFVDRLYWSMVDYGTSAKRLAVVIGGLFLISLALVSGEPQNFEHTPRAQKSGIQLVLAATHASDVRPATGNAADKAEMPFGARLWSTLKYHIPMVSAAISDDWKPANKPLRIALLPQDKQSGKPWLWPFPEWLRARDWFGLMFWINWLLWPLFLPYLIRKLARNRGAS